MYCYIKQEEKEAVRRGRRGVSKGVIFKGIIQPDMTSVHDGHCIAVCHAMWTGNGREK